MNFKERFDAAVLKEWSMFAIDYEALDLALKDNPFDEEGFHAIVEVNLSRLAHFLQDNEVWAVNLFPSIERQVSGLEPLLQAMTPGDENFDLMRSYLCVKKRVFSFHDELHLLLEFLELNEAALTRIISTHQPLLCSSAPETEIENIFEKSLAVLKGTAAVLAGLKKESDLLLLSMQQYWPLFQDEFKGKMCLAAGCFDLFHRGHRNFLKFLRELGSKYVVALLPDDEGYFHLKKRVPIDKYELRKENLSEFVDKIHTWNIQTGDFTALYIRVLKEEHMEASQCVLFSSDEHKELGKYCDPISLPFILLPRMERCSSTWIRAAYHEDPKV